MWHLDVIKIDKRSPSNYHVRPQMKDLILIYREDDDFVDQDSPNWWGKAPTDKTNGISAIITWEL